MRGLTDSPVAVEAAADGADPARATGAVGTSDPARSLRETLHAAVERHGERAVLLCSFQKEESVLLDELLQIGGGATPVRIVTIDTGVLFPETLETWRAFEQRFGIEVEVQEATPSDPALQWTGPEHCCSQAKVAALERALEGAEAWITGIRREQGPTRAQAVPVERDEQRHIFKYNPLAYWSEQDLWRRIHARELPYHPLHDRGYDSIGCAPCTRPGSGREGRWAGTEKTECGLHLPSDAAD